MESRMELWGMIWGAGPMVKFVLLLLLSFSVASWAIILYKFKMVKAIEKESRAFTNMFWDTGNFAEISSRSKNFKITPLARLFDGVYSELLSLIKTLDNTPNSTTEVYPTELDRFKRVLNKVSIIEKARMESTISFLATTGNTAPFIGLFGTVWGIMSSFRSIGIKGVANLAVVAPGISEALIATAIGLFAAIPAVVGYNYLLTKLDRINGEMENFSSDLLNIIDNKISKKPVQKRKN